MRLEILDQYNQIPRTERIPVGTNPVRLGRAESVIDTNGRPLPVHVQLPAFHVADVAATIGNEGKGWVLSVAQSRELRLGDRLLTAASPVAPVAHGDTFFCANFEVRVFFDEGELNTRHDELTRRAREASDLIGSVREKVVEAYSHKNTRTDRESELQDAFIQQLELDIAEHAGRADGFPRDGSAPTALGNYLAGLSVRSELLSQVVARADGRDGPHKADGWQRLRTFEKPKEEKFLRLVAALAERLDVARPHDELNLQLTRIGARFWDEWRDLLDDRAADPPLCFYLAQRRVKKEIKDVWYGHGPLEELLDDTGISEIMVVGPDRIFIETGGRLENTGRRFSDDAAVESLVSRIVDPLGRKVDKLEPIVDARMVDGSRVNVVIKPIALDGPYVTVRRFPTKRLTIDELIRRGSLTRSAASFLRAVVTGRRNVIVSGGTGTGKTTMLNCLSRFIPDHERVVTIEDTAELQLLEAIALDADIAARSDTSPQRKPHVVRMEARPKNLEGGGEKTIRDLVVTALRMRPDRIVVGECRRAEAIDMLQAMNTGHDGSMTTLHANSPADAIGRLEVMCMMDKDIALTIEAIHRQVVSAIDLIVQLSRTAEGKVVSEIAEVVGLESGGGVRLVSLFSRRNGLLRPTGHLASFATQLTNDKLIRSPLDLIRDDA